MPEIDPFDSNIGEIDYTKLIKQFGTQPIETIKNPPKIPNMKYVFSHRDFDKFIKSKKKSILTGFNASGSIHLGHTLTFNLVIQLQKKYKIPVYIPISDDESYVFDKIDNQEKGLKNAKTIITQLLALGFDLKLTKFFIHQQYTKIYNLAIKLSKRYTLSAIKAIYGFDDSTNPGKMFYPVIQAADIIFPQELLGKHSTLVPIGIDQDPHVRLARDIASKFGYEKPAAIHVKYMHGLRGGKMSKSIPGSAIFLNEDPEKAAKLVMRTVTGGQVSIEEQRKKGGSPEKCIVFEYLQAFFESDEQIKNRIKACKAGKNSCGDCKKLLAKNIKKYLENFQKKTKKFEKNLDKFLIK